jgi:repressor LexA
MAQREPLSERQERMLAMISEYIEENGYPPTIREIGDQCGISSTSVVSYNLESLRRKAYLERDSLVSRGIKVASEPGAPTHSTMTVPLLGFIAAGEPFPVPDSSANLDEVEDIELPADMVRSRVGVYALQVRGTSMIDALIGDGDIVIMDHDAEVQSGDMVAAWIEDEKATTLKRFYREDGGRTIRLQPANPQYEPIRVPADSLSIQGKVIGVIRRM